MEEELRGSGSIIGYRAMHQRLTTDHELIVTRNIVRQVLKIRDPEGLQARSGHRLRRRSYTTKSPDYLWHTDRYDKLKPFGFDVRGTIDGCRRKILLLKVSSSKNDPGIITKYYLDYARQIGGISHIIGADRETENGTITTTQKFFQRLARDDFRAEKSFMYGRSIANQRTSPWWGILRNWWINYFKDLRDAGLFCGDVL